MDNKLQIIELCITWRGSFLFER